MVKNNYKDILQQIGENPDREGLEETPKRIEKMFREIFRGYDITQKFKYSLYYLSN